MTDFNFVTISVDGKVEWSTETSETARAKTRAFIGDVLLDHFRGRINDRDGLFVVDDNGISKGLPRNSVATAAYRQRVRREYWDDAVIYGPTVGLFGNLAQ